MNTIGLLKFNGVFGLGGINANEYTFMAMRAQTLDDLMHARILLTSMMN
jgi:hypothetical protein